MKRASILLLMALAIATVVVTASTIKLRTQVSALVPAGKGWVAVTQEGLLFLDRVPKSKVLSMVVREVCTYDGVKLLVPTTKPLVCRVEALGLLKSPVATIFWNSTLISNFTCNKRYLFMQLLGSVKKGNDVVVFYPLENSICKNVQVDATVSNDTLTINITMTKLKPWLSICPPSKLYDVVVAEGKAKAVKIIVNNKVVLEERSPSSR